MALYNLTTNQKIPVGLNEVWDFISSAVNLKHITPPYMGFNIKTSGLPAKMYPGMIIAYNVSPILGIKMLWVTEITHVKEPDFFVDEQRVGPYKLWHHQHHLQTIEGGVLMTDIVNYQPPFGIAGDIANALVISKKLNEIFDYRFASVEKRFGKFKI